uniref:Uncharacterized protein n=1 Tax=Cacopsylla melanoneura TaxID=428564 RepID=A0A8D8T799_9HEMI
MLKSISHAQCKLDYPRNPRIELAPTWTLPLYTMITWPWGYFSIYIELKRFPSQIIGSELRALGNPNFREFCSRYANSCTNRNVVKTRPRTYPRNQFWTSKLVGFELENPFFLNGNFVVFYGFEGEKNGLKKR